MRKSMLTLALGGLVAFGAVAVASPAFAQRDDWSSSRYGGYYSHYPYSYYSPYYYSPPPAVVYQPPAYYSSPYYYSPPYYAPPRPGFGIYFRG